MNTSKYVTINRYSILQNDTDMDIESVNVQSKVSKKEQEVKACQRNKIIKKKILPLILHGSTQNHGEFIKLLNNTVGGKLYLKYRKNTVDVHIQEANDYEKIMEIWKEKEIKFHTYTRKEDKKRTYVLSGLHNQTDNEEIKSDLEQQGIMAMKVNKLKGVSRSKYMITVPNTKNLRHLQNKIKYVCHTRPLGKLYHQEKNNAML